MSYFAEVNHKKSAFENRGVSTLLEDSPLSPVERALMETDDQQFYARCRKAILQLNTQLVKAAEERSEFAPFLLEAMENAMSGLLEHGDERDLLLLEQWLDEENQ